MQLSATVATTGFANKAVTWSITKGAQEGKATINENGLLKIASDYVVGEEVPQIEVIATSIYDNTKTGTASVTVI